MTSIMKQSIFERTYFFFALDCCGVSSFQEALSPYLRKLSKFTSSNYACLKHADGHFWNVDLKTPSEQSVVAVTERKKNARVLLMVTHIADMRFVFRIFGLNGSEKTTNIFSFARTCSCCCKSDISRREDVQRDLAIGQATQRVAALPQGEQEQEEEPKPIGNFSVVIRKMAVQGAFYVTLPSWIRNWMPFSGTDCTITVRTKSKKGEEMFEEWKVKYQRRYYEKGGLFCRLQGGWKNVAKACALQEGDVCDFSLVDSSTWLYDFHKRSGKTDSVVKMEEDP